MLHGLHFKHLQEFLTFYHEYVPKANQEGRMRQVLFGRKILHRHKTGTKRK